MSTSSVNPTSSTFTAQTQALQSKKQTQDVQKALAQQHQQQNVVAAATPSGEGQKPQPSVNTSGQVVGQLISVKA